MEQKIIQEIIKKLDKLTTIENQDKKDIIKLFVKYLNEK